MPLTALTLVAGASLGGGVAAQLTVLIVIATVALVLIAGVQRPAHALPDHRRAATLSRAAKVSGARGG